MKSLSQYLFISLLLVIGAHSETVVEFGEIRPFYGPDDLNLDPEKIVVAIDVYGDEDRAVNGVLFEITKKHDNKFVYKTISITDKKNKFTFTERVRLIDKNQFLTYLNDLEMNLLYTFGDYKLNPHTPSSDRLLLVFQKRKINKN